MQMMVAVFDFPDKGARGRRTTSRSSPWTGCAAASPSDPQRRRLAEHEPARRRRAPGSSRSPGSRSSSARRARRAPPAARGASRCRRAGRGRRRGGAARWAGDVEAVGIGEDGRVAVGRRDRDADEVAARGSRAAELDVARGVAVDHRRRRLEPQRLLDGAGEQRRVGAHERELGRVRRAGAGRALAIIPSVVSMPPNSSTAAFETTSSGSSPPASSPRRRPASRRLALERRPDRVAQRREPSRPPRSAAARGDLRHRGDDRVVPAEHRRVDRLAARARA